MLAVTVMGKWQDVKPGEQSSKARPSADRCLCSFARFACCDRRDSAEAVLGECRLSVACSEKKRILKYDTWNRLRRLYYSSSWQVIEERLNGDVVDSYAWSQVYIGAMIARDRDSDGNGTLDERLYVTQGGSFNSVTF